MQPDPAHASSTAVEVGSVVDLWRYPVKSMMGEELNAAEVTDRGVVGDRHFAVVDASTGKVAGAKNPRKWGNFFDYRAAYVEPPKRGSKVPAVRVTLPDGMVVTSEQPDVAQVLSRAFGREVAFVEAGDGESPARQAEEYWPDMEGLDHRDTVTEWELPTGTFFDLAVVHLLTTLRSSVCASSIRTDALKCAAFGRTSWSRPRRISRASSRTTGSITPSGIGDEVRLRVTGACPRCVMITLSQADLPKDPGILRTAAQHNQANVGVYAEVIAGGTIRRGDRITVA